MKKIDEYVAEMKAVGNRLIPYNIPETENEVYSLKTRDVTIEGYDLILYYTKSRLENNFVEIFQVYGKNIPFLPFSLITKLAKKFLKDKNLNLVEVIKNNRKIYSWSSYVDFDGNSISCPYNPESETCTFEGWEYKYVQASQVNFY